MNKVLESCNRTLVSVSPDELVGIFNALNEVCNNSRLSDDEFQTRLGVTRESLADLLARMSSRINVKLRAAERADVWAQDGAVHIVCISAYGDPVELGVGEARDFADRLQLAMAEAQ